MAGMSYGCPEPARSYPGDAGVLAWTAGDGARETWSRHTRETPAGELVPHPWTGWSGWRSEWRRDVQAEDAIPLAVEAVGHVLTLTVSAEQTLQMVGSGVLDVVAVDPDGRPRTVLRARTSVRRRVTRD